MEIDYNKPSHQETNFQKLEEDYIFWQGKSLESLMRCIKNASHIDEVGAGNLLSRTMLHWASRWNQDPIIVRTLLGKKANVNALDFFQQTPLHLAAWKNPNHEITGALLSARPDVNIKDKWGRTPFDLIKENTDIKNTYVYEKLEHLSQ